MKIAILISGYLRTFENNINHFKNNVLQNYDVDIYFHKTKNEKNDKYNNTNNWDNIKKILKPKIILESDDEFKQGGLESAIIPEPPSLAKIHAFAPIFLAAEEQQRINLFFKVSPEFKHLFNTLSPSIKVIFNVA